MKKWPTPENAPSRRLRQHGNDVSPLQQSERNGRTLSKRHNLWERRLNALKLRIHFLFLVVTSPVVASMGRCGVVDKTASSHALHAGIRAATTRNGLRASRRV